MPLEPYREYSAPALAHETGVPLATVRAAIRRRELYARPGKRGRGNYARVLGQNAINWLERLHKLTGPEQQEEPQPRTRLEQVIEEGRRRLRATG